jgi:hypothetical protein
VVAHDLAKVGVAGSSPVVRSRIVAQETSVLSSGLHNPVQHMPRSLVRVVEMADAHGSGPCAREGVRVQAPPRTLA